MMWNDWIASKECLPTVRYIRSLFSYKEEGLIRATLGLADAVPPDKDSEEQDPLDDEILSEFWIFLQVHLSNKNKNEISSAIEAGTVSTVANILKFAFINHCKDLRRKNNPYYRCYTSLREKLHKTSKTNKSLRYNADRNGAFYSFCEKEPTDHSPEIWSQFSIHKYRSWKAPSCVFTVDAPAVNAVEVAKFFWNESINHLSDNCWIPVRELTTFIFAKYDALEGYEVENSSFGSFGEDGEPKDVPEKRLMPKVLEDYYKKDLVTEAKQLVSTWDVKKKVIFHLKFQMDLTLRQIEEQGYRSVQYNIDKAKESILSQWYNWMPDGTNDEELFDFFCSEVLKFVNNDIVAVKINSGLEYIPKR